MSTDSQPVYSTSFRFKHNLMTMKKPICTALKEAEAATLTEKDVESIFNLVGFVPDEFLIEQFIRRTYEHWPQLATTKDPTAIVEVLLDNGFKDLIDKGMISEIRSLSKSGKVSKFVQDELLKIGRSLVKISINHCKENDVRFSDLVDYRKMAK